MNANFNNLFSDDELLQIKKLSIVSLGCLLLDQFDSQSKGNEYFGAWGRTTIDYVFQCTRDYSWKDWFRGSITQTAWALQTLDIYSKVDLPKSLKDAISFASSRAEMYVTNGLSKGFMKERSSKVVRHNTTCMLAYQFLPSEPKSPATGSSSQK